MTRISAIGIALLCIFMRNLLRLKIKTDYYRIFFRNGLFSGYDRHGSYHCTVLCQRLYGEISSAPCPSGGYTRPSKRKQQHFPLCAGTERHKACRHTERLYGDRNAGGARHVYDIPATFQLHPSGCLRLCGGHHQYAPSLQQGDERPFEVRRDREDWYRREL